MKQISPIITLNKIFLFCIAPLLLTGCSSSNSNDLSLIVGNYIYSTSKNMGGYDISGVWKLNITKNGDGDYSYSIGKIITDQMYGGNPKSEISTGKFATTLDNSNDWYLIGYSNAHISIPFGGFKEAPSEITMYGDGDPKHFIRVYSSSSSSTNSPSSNSNENNNSKVFEDISGDYYGESIMGNDVGVGQISINSSGKIGVYYNHGDLGSAKEYGNLVPSQNSQNANELYFKFQKDAGGDYDIKIIKSPAQIVVILTGVNWQVTASRSLKSNTLVDTTSQNENSEPETNNQGNDQIQENKQDQINKVDNLMSSKDYTSAINILDGLISNNQSDADLFFKRAWCKVYRDGEANNSAVDDYSKAIEFNGSYWGYYNDRANCLRSLKRYDEALSDYNTSINLEGGSKGFMFYNRAICKLELRDTTGACEDLQTSLQKGWNSDYYKIGINCK